MTALLWIIQKSSPALNGKQLQIQIAHSKLDLSLFRSANVLEFNDISLFFCSAWRIRNCCRTTCWPSSKTIPLWTLRWRRSITRHCFTNAIWCWRSWLSSKPSQKAMNIPSSLLAQVSNISIFLARIKTHQTTAIHFFGRFAHWLESQLDDLLSFQNTTINYREKTWNDIQVWIWWTFFVTSMSHKYELMLCICTKWKPWNYLIYLHFFIESAEGRVYEFEKSTVQRSLEKLCTSLLFADTGVVYKIIHWHDVVKQEVVSRIADVWDDMHGEAIRTMVVSPDHRSLYVASDSQVLQYSIASCRNYGSCAQCTKDPFCVWSRQNGKCQDISEISGK